MNNNQLGKRQNALTRLQVNEIKTINPNIETARLPVGNLDLKAVSQTCIIPSFGTAR